MHPTKTLTMHPLGTIRYLPAMLLALLAIALPASAAATQPTREVAEFTRDFGVVGSCDGFAVTLTLFVTRTVTTFYDQDGTPIRQEAHAEVPGVLTNTVTGTSLPVFGLRHVSIDLVTGEVTSTGTGFHVVVPGQGTISLGAGRFVLDASGNLVQASGRQDPPVTPEVCAALA